jgi:MtN3 and saliva related transmembrane protein
VEEDNMNFFDMLQLIGGTLLALSYLPQIYKTFKVKRVDEISLAFWSVLFAGLCLMEINAVHLISLGTWSYAITETFNVLLCGIFLFQVIYYTIKNRK